MRKKSWDEFRSSGLAWFINQTLHIFGWCLIFEVDKDTQIVTDCYPARTKFRGFTEADQDEGYKKVHKFLEENIDIINAETNEI